MELSTLIVENRMANRNAIFADFGHSYAGYPLRKTVLL